MPEGLKKFRPKSKNIEAVQIKLTTFDAIVEWLTDLNYDVDGNSWSVNRDQETITFQTPYGFVTAGYNWWVARNANGQFYPISPKGMKVKYEEVV